MDIKIPTVAEVRQMIVQKYGAEDKESYFQKIFKNLDEGQSIVEFLLKISLKTRLITRFDIANFVESELISIDAQKDMKIKALEERVAQLEIELKQKQE